MRRLVRFVRREDMLVGGVWGVDGDAGGGCIERCIGWVFGVLQRWVSRSGVVGAVVEKEGEGLDGVLGDGV